jgi:imidazolonepropionase-like amidohydrolase
MMRAIALAGALAGAMLPAQVAVRGGVVHTMAGPPIADGVVVIRDGKIAAVGPAAEVAIPDGFEVLRAAVVTPGLIDAHTAVGLSGIYNQPHDQDQRDKSAAMQPDLRAIDAYNPREPLLAWVRGFGVTTLHTGHSGGGLIAGQTMIVKARGTSVEAALVQPFCMVAATLGEGAQAEDGKAPGNRSKAIAMLRAELQKAREYAAKVARAAGDPQKLPPRDLGLETLGAVLERRVPLLVTVHRSHDILAALRVAREFEVRLVLDGAAEAHELLGEIAAAGVPVLAHPPMMRHVGERENATFELGARLAAAKIPFAYQSGYESYVPKTRVVLFEAAVGAAHGLGFERALQAITSDAAMILGVADRVGSLAVGKDGDVALFDGDPFEYATHCIGVVIDGEVASREVR